MKIAFGLQNLLCEVDEFSQNPIVIRPGATELLGILKQNNHQLILWTTLKRSKVSFLKANNTHFFEVFDTIYCKEDISIEEDIPGCSPHEFKNIDKIKADCMIECKRSYSLYSKNMNLSEKYLIVGEYREVYYKELSPWQARVLGEDGQARWKERFEKREEWIYDVLSFVENLNGQSKNTE